MEEKYGEVFIVQTCLISSIYVDKGDKIFRELQEKLERAENKFVLRSQGE